MKSLPGDPFLEEHIFSKEVAQSLRAHYGLDESLLLQYLRYLKGSLFFDFGPSLIRSQTVARVIAEEFPLSAQLGFQALCIAIPLGIILGVISTFKNGRWQDHVIFIFSILGVCIPNFVLAVSLQFFFSSTLHLFPVARWDSFSHTILPSLSLALFPAAFIARLTRVNLIKVLQQDFIRTALGKGLSHWKVLFFHALRNALLPILSYLGPASVKIFMGSFVVERIFALPGLGTSFIQAIMHRDYPMILGLTFFYSLFLMSIIFFIDLLYCWLDPRIRFYQK